MFTASIVIPCYNEEKTLRQAVGRVREIAGDTLQLELLIVDDCSQDGSLEIARELENEFTEVRSFRHEVNQGKGAALRTGFREATGDVVAVQDADLEYDPHDLRKLIQLIQDDKADVAMGSRFITGGPHRIIYFWHSIGNRFLTFFSNMMTDLNLSDMETCYKVFRREVL
ncbi:MAG: glycosyltransferase family 2 protein, partial [Opitutales bacterium]|nr:glycosyltransferase family 2 protein [Opitutales bacterium]